MSALPFSGLLSGRRILLTIVGMCVAIIAVVVTSRVVASVLEHQEKYQFLAQALDQDTAQPSLVDWRDTITVTGRDFTDSDRAIVGKRLADAWRRLILANRSANIAFLEDYFDGPALEQASNLAENADNSIEKGLVVFSQEPQARFFHADGSLLEIASEETLTLRYAIDKVQDRIAFQELARECTRSVLVLHSIGWKIRNHEIDCHQAIAARSHFNDRRDPGLPLKGINYYPANTPWLDFWQAFDAKTIESDFSLIADLGANSIRIFLPFDYFYDEATRDSATKRLEHLLFLADRQKLLVVPTLFDFRSSYDPADYAVEYNYLKTVVEVLRRHKNVRLIDIKNEPDLDYQRAGKARVDMWLRVFSDLLHYMAPEFNTTIGWLNHENAAAAANMVDVISYHEYASPDDSSQVYASVKKQAFGKPVIVSEIGKPSWSLALGFPFNEVKQADWTARQLKALAQSDGVMIWTLHDFPYEQAGKVASLPWRKSMQASYGIYDRNGEPKPVAEIFRNFSLEPNWNSK